MHPRWQPGRQGTGYWKLRLLALRRLDLYLLRFPPGSRVPAHRDAVPEGRHLRLNLVLVPARRGGEFRCPAALIDRPRIKLFRSDLHAHEVTPVEEGTRWVLSCGLLLP
ncbi:MAG: 2OG-Fe(II) oxygenase [Myxococcales bacterium]|nr:2OG-Fe(II) oxygenase [Myxococcales bacterium]MCB9755163.1 2OG-Fe(II) oxygenase [Myxococcales bacterium]